MISIAWFFASGLFVLTAALRAWKFHLPVPWWLPVAVLSSLTLGLSQRAIDAAKSSAFARPGIALLARDCGVCGMAVVGAWLLIVYGFAAAFARGHQAAGR